MNIDDLNSAAESSVPAPVLESPIRPNSLNFPASKPTANRCQDTGSDSLAFANLGLPAAGSLFRSKVTALKGSRTASPSPQFLPSFSGNEAAKNVILSPRLQENRITRSPPTGVSMISGRNTISELDFNPMKRSNSAPVINLIGIDKDSPGWPADGLRSPTLTQFRASLVPQEKCDSMDAGETSGLLPRSRHSSSRSVSGFPVKIPAKRVNAIRRESSVSFESSDLAREKLIQCSALVSNSLEDFNLNEVERSDRKRTKSLTEPISVFTHFLPSSSCSPSPNSKLDKEKQCYSPSTQQVVRQNIGLSPSPSPTPSPTRRSALMRSLSPIAIRPTMFGMKRKCDSELDGTLYTNSPKRANNVIYSHSFGGSAATTSTVFGSYASPIMALTPDRVFPPSQLVKYSTTMSISSDSESSNGGESTVSDQATNSSNQSFSQSASSTPNPTFAASNRVSPIRLISVESDPAESNTDEPMTGLVETVTALE